MAEAAVVHGGRRLGKRGCGREGGINAGTAVWVASEGGVVKTVTGHCASIEPLVRPSVSHDDPYRQGMCCSPKRKDKMKNKGYQNTQKKDPDATSHRGSIGSVAQGKQKQKQKQKEEVKACRSNTQQRPRVTLEPGHCYTVEHVGGAVSLCGTAAAHFGLEQKPVRKEKKRRTRRNGTIHPHSIHATLRSNWKERTMHVVARAAGC
ncbi:hypothetical protein C8F04DRAFT_1237011 [Mycena alexandri]|uniref:Uncharacterized protein n=1 Tax=Mycena alexandri TaxID=1745969 RepID=A0AAD6SL16_9AGAR|nr:hypothetical protein C8F04DRAFT_1237011 [Mycena alexandri]